jgi:hypothetical protein
MKNIQTYDLFLENYSKDEILLEGIVPDAFKSKLQKIAKKYSSKFTKMVEKFKGKSVEEIITMISKEKPELSKVVTESVMNESAVADMTSKIREYLGGLFVGGVVLTLLVPAIIGMMKSVDISIYNQYSSSGLTITIALAIFTIITYIADRVMN